MHHVINDFSESDTYPFWAYYLQMNKLKWINKSNLTACFEAGIIGKEIEELLSTWVLYLLCSIVFFCMPLPFRSTGALLWSRAWLAWVLLAWWLGRHSVCFYSFCSSFHSVFLVSVRFWFLFLSQCIWNEEERVWKYRGLDCRCEVCLFSRSLCFYCPCRILFTSRISRHGRKVLLFSACFSGSRLARGDSWIRGHSRRCHWGGAQTPPATWNARFWQHHISGLRIRFSCLARGWVNCFSHLFFFAFDFHMLSTLDRACACAAGLDSLDGQYAVPVRSGFEDSAILLDCDVTWQVQEAVREEILEDGCISHLFRFRSYVTKALGFDVNRMAAVTLMFEGLRCRFCLFIHSRFFLRFTWANSSSRA